MMRRLDYLCCLLVAVCFACASHAQTTNNAALNTFTQDIAALTAHPHRLAGSDANAQAAAYIRQQLEQTGITNVATLNTPVWLMQQGNQPATLQVGGQTLALELIRSNIIAPPVTPTDGITGPLRYLGNGDPLAPNHRDLTGCIAVLDYDATADAWHRAFERGARAVIFLGSANDATPFLKHAPIPVNLPRFYAPANTNSANASIDLTQDHPQATLRASAQWSPQHAPSIFAVIPGSDTTNNPGVIVLSATLDTFGSVPHRTPGARQAGNAAMLLHAARTWAHDPPKQTVALAFFNGQAVGLEASRNFYDTLQLTEADHNNQTKRHKQEAEYLDKLDGDLQKWLNQPSQPVTSSALLRLLQREADAAAADLAKQRRDLRLMLRDLASDAQGVQQQLETLASIAEQWDTLRRALHTDADNPLASLPPDAPVITQLQSRTRAYLQQSKTQLIHAQRIDEQQRQLRAMLGITADTPDNPIRLHADLELSGDTPTWGVYLGNDTDDFTQARSIRPSGDAPGYYAATLAHLRTALPETFDDSWAGLDPRTLRDPWGGRRLVTAEIPTAGTLAGHHGLHHLALTNLHDARPREGHPADTADQLSLANFFKQGDAALRFIQQSIDTPGLPTRPSFNNHATRLAPRWSPRGSDGPSVQRWVVGGLSEDRPAAGVMVAVWPAHEGDLGRDNAWPVHAQAGLPFYEPARIVRTNAHGRYALPAMHDELDLFFISLAADFDSQGHINAIATWDTLIQGIASAPRTDLLPASGDAVVFRPHEYNEAQPLTVLLPSRDTRPRGNNSLRGKHAPFNFVYLANPLNATQSSMFQIGGPVRLDLPQEDDQSESNKTQNQKNPTTNILTNSAENLWQVDEDRLDQLRRRAIIRQDLEGLHRRASSALNATPNHTGNISDNADTSNASNRVAYALSRRVYAPLRGTMNDLVAGIIVLLGLTIPFAFSLERLVLGAKGIQGRVAGFTVCFLITFVILYLTHPGFAIATAPVLIFLAFAILLMSSLVIVLLARKFRVELAAIHGQSAATHQLDTSHAATLIAAIQIGISTMRRRRTRTALTLLTVTVLTFTVVCFAGFEPKLAIRTTALGPTPDTAPANAYLIRSIDYQPLPTALRELTQSTLQDNTNISEPMVWRSSPSLTLARSDGQRDTQFRAVLGMTPETIKRWDKLSQALGSDTATTANAFNTNGVFLPPRLARSLNLQVGDTLRIEGRLATVAGLFDPDAVTRLRHLDNRPVLPVDFLDAASALIASAGGNQQAMGEFTAQEFQYLSATQTVIAGADFTRTLGGETHLLTLFPVANDNPEQLAADLARVSPTPVWSAGTTGLERKLLTMTAALDAGPSLLVPLILGGLIVFGTLLGSITDRKEEIATFSALGLGPAHVGALFVAEAAVYAVVGGMGGQLLAQIVAASAHALSQHGIGRPLPINYASSNALLAITAVGVTVMVSALYPAWRAARSANPGVERAWQPPKPKDGKLDARLPFTLSAYDMTGVMAFLAEHLAAHDDAGLGSFATQSVSLRPGNDGRPQLFAEVALAPFDLGVTQSFTLAPAPTDLPGVDEVAVVATRNSGSTGDWSRTNRVFLRDLRKQFLIWRTLSPDSIQHYRDEALRAMQQNQPVPMK